VHVKLQKSKLKTATITRRFHRRSTNEGVYILVNIQKCLAVVLFLIGAPAFADNTNDPFQEVVAKYLAAKPKPVLSEEARKFKVQAEFMVQEKQVGKAIELYGKALNIAPWWPEGHFQLALILGETKKYREATLEMKRYLLLAPDGADARSAQDKIYQWEMVTTPEAGKTYKDCPECPEMVEIPMGSFDMGSNNGESDEKPVHRVTITKSFAIGKTEVTQAQWHAVMGNEPSYFTACGDACPVEQVSWNDAQEFIQKLNAKSGKQYRLPTEAEWEYACRAGNQQEYCGSDIADSVSWNSFNSGSFFFNTPHPVATKQANAFGLYDMSGNVWEWVEDGYHDNYAGAPVDGSAWEGGSMHVLRGGSWGYDQKFGRSASRSKFGPNFRYYSYGFRLARTLP
jgi:formylglycine-generating enzyme required for sulfatase activity